MMMMMPGHALFIFNTKPVPTETILTKPNLRQNLDRDLSLSLSLSLSDVDVED